MGTSATVGRLTVAVEADVSTLAPSLNQGAQSVREFASETKRTSLTVEQLAGALNGLGISAKGLGANKITVPAADLENARQIASRYNAEITVMAAVTKEEAQAAAIAEREIRRMGLAETQAYEIDAKRTTQLRQLTIAQEQEAAAKRISALAARDYSQSASAAAASTSSLHTNALGFNAVTSRLAPATLAVSFGLAQMATAGNNADSALRTVLRAASVAALALGPEGILVGAALAAGDAIFTAFDKTRKEIEETTRKGAAEIFRFRQSLNVGGLAQLAQQQFSGGQALNAAGDVVFEEGIQQLQRRIAHQRRIVEEGTSGTGQVSEAASKALGEIDKLTPALQRLQAQHTATMAALKETLATVVDQATTGFKLEGARKDIELMKDAVRELARASLELQRAGVPGRAQLRATPSVVLRDSPAETGVTVQALAQTRSGFLDATTAASAFGGEVEHAAAAALRLVDSVGFLPAAFRNAVSAVAGIGAGLREGSNALAALRSAQTVGGALQAGASLLGAAGNIVGPLAALGQALFAQSAETRENNRLLAQNVQALRDARLAATGFDPRSASAVRDLLGALQITQTPRGSISGTLSLNSGTGDRAIFERFLAPFKVSIDEAEASAKAFGINLYNASGQLDPRVLTIFRDRLLLAADDLRQFGASMTEQRSKLELSDAVHDRTGGAADFTREVGLLGQFAPNLAAGFKDLDVSTAAGLAAAKKALADLFDRFAAGGLSLDDLDKLDKGSFLDFVRGADSALDSLASSAQTAAGQLLNVPQGFRLALRTFEAQVATSLSGSSGGSAFPVSAGFPSSAMGGGTSTTTNTVSVTVQVASTAPNAPQLARELGDVFVQKGAALGTQGVPLVNLGRALRA